MRTGALIGNVIWILLCGIWLAIGHLLTAVAMAVTIVGIPLALANLKLIPVSLVPLGKEIVPVHQQTPSGGSPEPANLKFAFRTRLRDQGLIPDPVVK